MKLRTVTFLLLISSLPFAASAQIRANLSPKNPSCYGSCDGGATLTVSGGSGNYHFVWSNSTKDTCSVNTLCAGPQRVTITDGVNSPVPFSFSLSNPPKLNAYIAEQGPTSCFGAKITIKATGGMEPYKDTGTFTSPAGDYIFIVKDNNQCRDTVPVSIAPAQAIKLNITLLDTACYNTLAHMQVRVSGGVGPYTGDTGYISRGGGVQYIRVEDAMGCPAIDTVKVPVYNKVNVTIAADTAILCSSDSALIYITTDTLSTYNYLWSNGATTSSIYAKKAGNFYVKVTDENRCSVESNRVKINIHTPASVAVSINGDTLIAYNAMGYQWLKNNEAIEGAVQQMYIVKQSGSYAVNITDSNGCHAISTPVQVDVVNGIGDFNDDKLAIYPNPSVGGVYKLTVAPGMVGQLAEVYDLGGKLVYQTGLMRTNSTISIDAPAGIYVLRVQDGENTLLRKLVKQ